MSDYLDVLILAGWGDVPQNLIPEDVMQAARSGGYVRPRQHERRAKREQRRPRSHLIAAGEKPKLFRRKGGSR